ncbi:type II toxin-antitoxin system HipA family toxin [Leifsonia sp. ZF2019]|uniref:type II toxin-antitoxin system HipA family toxin n=1 Tax=Leifsonia sp. ZF2019 TaxID=2781978 RepID=UPI001CBDDAC0|nr:type II toxin-antitoxin system HipA family toxin [Leifsonia sp. ZF2019]UAJ78720.1 type II toxin-antitoxin system HipA family toxin [Leifsonia sp. ZF2019]
MTHYEVLQVHVELAGATVLVGRAQFHRGRGALASTTFQYDPDFLSKPHSYPIDPAFPLASGTHYVQGLPGAFTDSAPDRWGRTLLAKRERALARKDSRRAQELDDVDYLSGVGDITRQGALRFRVDDESAFLDPDHTVPRLLQLPTLLHSADLAAQDGDDLAAVKTLLDAGTGSLGGARPKAAVLGEDGRQLIAKFPHHEDDWDVMAWEATALDLAAAAGVAVPIHRLVRIDGRHLLLLDRFDRTLGISVDRPGRIGYISAMTLLGRRAGDGGDYIDIAESVEEVSDGPTDDALQLFRRAAVNVGLNNTDDHLRNHGLLRRRAGWSLSPAFDINPNPTTRARQTSIAGADRPSDEAAGMLELARACRLQPDDVRRELGRIMDAVSDWRATASRNAVPPSELMRFEDSFTTGLAVLTDARSLAR